MRFYLLCVSLLVTLSALAQSLPQLSQNPASLRWYRLKTPHFRVLYPEGFGGPAQHTAQQLERNYAPVSAGLSRPPRPVSVILQNQTSVSNGFVTLIPRRAEFFTTPPQDPFLLGTLNWLDELSVHEFRHVVQYDKALQGFSRGVYSVLGYGALAGLTLGLPDWFWEGDAVGTETVLTRSGRGRIPNFALGYRANLLAGRRFDYSKSVGGSYRDNVPNHYVLGYFLTTYLKRTYGAGIWGDVLNRYYRFPLYPFSFSNSLKKQTGLRVEELYRRAIDDIDETFRQQQKDLRLTDATRFLAHTESRVFTNYQYPQYINDSTVLAVKSGLGDISQLVLLNRAGQEKRVFVQGLVNDPGNLSASAGKACWIEYRYDPRWSQRVYSEIRLLDLNTGTLTHLTSRSRFTAAALSPDGSKLVAVQSGTDYQTRLVVLDARTGHELSVLPNAENDFYVQPRWRADNQTIVTVTLKPAGKTIEAIDSQTGAKTALLPVTSDNLSHAQPWGPFVFYNSPQSGIDNIYAVDTRSGETRSGETRSGETRSGETRSGETQPRTFQVTSRPLGAYHAAVSPNGKQLAFHDFSADGYRIAGMPLDTTQWVTTQQVQDREIRYFGPTLKQEPVSPLTYSLADSTVQKFTPTRFHRLANAINIYSWGPVLTTTGQALQVGLSSQDLLSTTQLQAGYAYNQTEHVGNFFANLSYQGLYPIIDVGFQSGNRHTSFSSGNGLVDDQWHYNQLTAGLRLPLNLTRSKYLQSLVLSAYYGYQQVTGYDLPVRYLTDVGAGRSVSTLTYSFAYARTLKQSKRDVAPRWGQTFSTTLRNTPFGTTLAGWQWGTSASVYLPGLLKHQSLRLRGAYQRQWGRSDAGAVYQFASAIAYPRGADYIAYDQIRFGAAEYRLPLLSPHWTLGRLLYIQRVNGMLFSDYAKGISQVPQRSSSGVVNVNTVRGYDWTLGADVSFVFNALRLRTPFQAGARTIYNVRTGQWLLQPLVLDIGF